MRAVLFSYPAGKPGHRRERKGHRKGGAFGLNTYPIIGVSGSLNDRETELFLMRSYSSALTSVGAVPLLLSPEMTDAMLDVCLERLDGLLLAGGNDMAPELFGDLPIAQLGEVNPLRDDFEMRIIPKAFALKMPILGICRGIQSLNVAMGGTLWQDLPSQYRTKEQNPPIAHSQSRPGIYTSHSVKVEKDSLLYRISAAQDIRVNSFHHQAVRSIAPGFHAVAHAPDGVIEAIEHPDHPFCLGVQWHPERYYDRAKEAGELFRAFAQAARNDRCAR